MVPSIIFFTDSTNEKLPIFSFETPFETTENFRNQFNDNFGLKSEMLDHYIKFKLNTFNETPLPNKVLIGKDGWYFLGNTHRNLLDDSFGDYPFSKSDLKKFKETIKTIKDTLESKGIAFHMVVPPNKHRVYSEKLPYRLTQQPTRLEELNSFLKKEIDFEILDLRDTLVASKNEDLLYYKTNTHWNDLGAYIGYRKTLESLRLDVPLDSVSNYTFEYKPIERGDITEMINLKFKENAIFFNSVTNTEIEVLNNKRHFLHFKNPSRNKKIILYRDSFANFWIKHFNQSFGETIYFRGYNMNFKYIFNQKPDAVVIEVIERNLSHIIHQLEKKLSKI